MDTIVNTSWYNVIISAGGLLLTLFVIGVFCYLLFRHEPEFKKWGKVRRIKIDGPVGSDS